jgi:mono/diheme cytochrome c family protein
MRFTAAICAGLWSAVVLSTSPTHQASRRTLPYARQASGQSDSLGVTEAEYQGWKLFHANCDRCHGQDATGSSFAPNLRHSVGPQGSLDREAFVLKTIDGVVDKGMPAWNGILSREQTANIYAYVRARSTGRLAAGRPRVVPETKP